MRTPRPAPMMSRWPQASTCSSRRRCAGRGTLYVSVRPAGGDADSHLGYADRIERRGDRHRPCHSHHLGSVTSGNSAGTSARPGGTATTRSTSWPSSIAPSRRRYWQDEALRRETTSARGGRVRRRRLPAGARIGRLCRLRARDRQRARRDLLRQPGQRPREPRRRATGRLDGRHRRPRGARAWNAALGRVAITGGTDPAPLFYTALYHRRCT